MPAKAGRTFLVRSGTLNRGRDSVDVDANLGARYRFVEAALDVQNLFNVPWREVQFATTSRLTSEPIPVTGISMTPGWPRTLLARLALYVD